MDDVRRTAEERAKRPKTAPVGASFEPERQRSKNALVKQLDSMDGRNVRKIAAVADAPQEEKARALWTYGIQLAFNFLWPIAFFNLKWYLFAFLWLVILWILILITALRFGRIRKPAGYLLVPYLLWVAFAGYLNLGIYLLNP